MVYSLLSVLWEEEEGWGEGDIKFRSFEMSLVSEAFLNNIVHVYSYFILYPILRNIMKYSGNINTGTGITLAQNFQAMSCLRPGDLANRAIADCI